MSFPIQFIVPVNPIPKQSYRHKKDGGYQEKRIKDAQKIIGIEANLAMGGMPPTVCNIVLTAEFYRSTHHRVDIDNLLKLLGDSMNKIVYEDDYQITEVNAKKVYCPDNPRTEVTVDIIT